MTMDPTQPVAPETGPSLAPSVPVAYVAPVVAVSPRPRLGGVLNLLLIGAAILAVGGVAFAIGRSTAPAGAFPGVGGLNGGPIMRSDGSFDPGTGGPGSLALDGGLAIEGTVASLDADSVTLTLDNGEEMTFALDGDTRYHEATDATSADVSIGDEVSVKVEGGGRMQRGSDALTTPDLSARDITVAR